MKREAGESLFGTSLWNRCKANVKEWLAKRRMLDIAMLLQTSVARKTAADHNMPRDQYVQVCSQGQNGKLRVMQRIKHDEACPERRPLCQEVVPVEHAVAIPIELLESSLRPLTRQYSIHVNGLDEPRARLGHTPPSTSNPPSCALMTLALALALSPALALVLTCTYTPPALALPLALTISPGSSSVIAFFL